MSSRHLPRLLAALLGALLVLAGLDQPLSDDGLFWWVPKALWILERGPSWIPAGELPQALLPDSELPPQWQQGLPDYGHPPLWYHYLSLWMWALGPTHHSVHLAVVPLGALLGLGLVELCRRLGGREAAWAAPALLLLPPVVTLLWRADTDLPLTVLSLWALIAVLDRRPRAFVLLSVLATWSKEPGVLLSAVWVGLMLWERRWSWAWLGAPMSLMLWAGIHHSQAGWALAGSERLPPDLISWLLDLLRVGGILFLEQGRFLILLPALYAWRQGRRLGRAGSLILLFCLTQWALFGTLNFLGGMQREDHFTHLRYLVPGLLAAGSLGIALSPRIAGASTLLASLTYLTLPSPWGPEASLYAPLTQRAAEGMIAELPRDEPVWVGSYTWTQWTRTFAGGAEGIEELDLRMYSMSTVPEEVQGWVLSVPMGEPLGRLQELDLRLHSRAKLMNSEVLLYRVE